MSTETETPIEEKKTPTTRFAEWLMARQEKKEAKETSLESLMKFNIFLSIATLVTVAGASVAEYVMMAYLWI
jgi:hypothetical protein